MNLSKSTNYIYDSVTSGPVFYQLTGQRKKGFRELFLFDSLSLSLALFLSGGSMYLRGDHQSNRLYYYFSTKCFDFQPTQKIKPPSSSLPSPSFPPTYLFFSLLYFLTHFLTSALYFFPKSFVLPLSFLRLFHLKKCSPAKMEGFHCVILFDKLDNTCLDAL